MDAKREGRRTAGVAGDRRLAVVKVEVAEVVVVEAAAAV